MKLKENLKMIDYICYIDTDSIFLAIQDFLINQGVPLEVWDALSHDEKIHYTIKISKEIEKYVNDNSFNKVQKQIYNSQVDDFKIVWKQEMVMQSVLFVQKKKYGYRLVNKEGTPKDKIDVTGLEIIRSETPIVFREALTKVLDMILKKKSDNDIIKFVNKAKKSIDFSDPNLICANIGINNISKFVDKDNNYKKGTPYHIKGVSNYRNLLQILGLKNKYEDIKTGDKAKVTYVKKNPHGVNVITFYEWPEEFSKIGIEVDTKVQIEKFFVKKVEYLLSPMGKQDILKQNQTALGSFFGNNTLNG
jgi:DNA polymerase elongation subunit (family B)